MRATFTSSLACAGVALLFAASSATAYDTLTYSLLTANDKAPWGATLGLPKFDPALGTLVGVQIDFTGSGSATIQVEHGVGAGSVEFDPLGTTTQITVPGLIALTDNSKDFLFLWPAGSPSPTSFSTGIYDNDTLNLIDPSFWGEYTGIGDFPVDFFAQEVIGTMTASGDFGQVDFIETYGGGLVGVTYSYNPVPEPGTIAVGLITALGAAGTYWRRRKAA